MVSALLVIAASAAVAVACILWVIRSEDAVRAATIVGGVFAPLAVFVALALGVQQLMSPLDLSRGSDAQRVDELLKLHESVQDFWRLEAAQRGISIPATITIGWELDEWVLPRLQKDISPGSLPDDVPRVMPPQTLTSGVLNDLHSLYSTVAGGKLILSGPPGSGKTASLILLLLAACSHRQRNRHSQQIPLPILLPLSEWDPDRVPLREWASDLIRRDHPHLKRLSAGHENFLFKDSRISLFLDGLDEMPQHHRRAALRAITRETSLRIVVTCRQNELAETIRVSGENEVPVVRLCQVSLQSASQYLVTWAPPEKVAMWEAVISACRSGHLHVREALSTPLMLNLARETFLRSDADPRLLLNTRALPSAASIRSYLIAQIIPNALPNLKDRSRIQHLLTWVATNMQSVGTTDLAWWRIRLWRYSWSHLSVVSLAFALFTGGGFVILGAPGSVCAAVGLAWAMGTFIAGTVVIHLGRRRNSADLRGVRPMLAVALIVFAIFSTGLIQLGRWVEGAARSGWASPVPSALFLGALSGLSIGLVSLHDGYMHASVRAPGRGVLLSGTFGACVSYLLLQEFVDTVAAAACAVAGVAGFVIIAAWTRPPIDLVRMANPRTTHASDVKASWWFGAMGGLVVSIGVGISVRASGMNWGATAGTAMYFGVFAGLCGALATSRAVASQTVWATHCIMERKAPSNFFRKLELAYLHQILRQSGPAYQFRHAELQDYLSHPNADPLIEMHHL